MGKITTEGSKVRVFLSADVKQQMVELNDIRKEAGLPYLSFPRICQKVTEKNLADFIRQSMEEMKSVNV